MPKISDIEETPNPNAVKFILKEAVSNGTTHQFASAEAAQGDPLAKSLFDVGQVVSVFYMDRMITVEKEEFADWDDLLPTLAVPIRAAVRLLRAGDAPVDVCVSEAQPQPRLVVRSLPRSRVMTHALCGSTRYLTRRYAPPLPAMADGWKFLASRSTRYQFVIRAHAEAARVPSPER